MSKHEYSDQDYYWEKAEFQDPVAHRQHVENYKKGIRSSIAFDEQYMQEARDEMKGEHASHHREKRLDGSEVN